MVEMRFVEDIENQMEAEFISEVTAVFTTANARLRLFDMLYWLHPSQVCYCDTDSVIFLYDENNPLHKKPTNDQDLPNTIRFAPNKEANLGEWEN